MFITLKEKIRETKMLNFLFKRQQNKVQKDIDGLNPDTLVYNYQKILEFTANRFPKMRWDDNYLDEDIWAKNTDEICKFHNEVKRFYIDYPLSTYKMKLYCDKNCKYLFEDLFNGKEVSQDENPITHVKCSFTLNGKTQHKMIKISKCKFTLKRINNGR